MSPWQKKALAGAYEDSLPAIPEDVDSSTLKFPPGILAPTLQVGMEATGSCNDVVIIVQDVSLPKASPLLRAQVNNQVAISKRPIPRVINLLNGMGPNMEARRRPIQCDRRGSLTGFTHCTCNGIASRFMATCNVCGKGWYQTIKVGFARTGSTPEDTTIHLVSNQVSKFGGWATWTGPDATRFGEVPLMPRGPEPPTRVFHAPGSEWIKSELGIWELQSHL